MNERMGICNPSAREVSPAPCDVDVCSLKLIVLWKEAPWWLSGKNLLAKQEMQV